MTPVEVLSRLHARILLPIDAWKIASARLHESMGWSAVLSHALKMDPELHPELYAILDIANSYTDVSINIMFNSLKIWASGKHEHELAPALAIWASQTQIEHCTIADLVKATPLAWRWEIAAALMPTGQIRGEHETLIHVLWMDALARNQSMDQHAEPSICSTVFSP